MLTSPVTGRTATCTGLSSFAAISLRDKGGSKPKPLLLVATSSGKEGVDGSSPSEGFDFLPA
jgi:hypothetical protein